MCGAISSHGHRLLCGAGSGSNCNNSAITLSCSRGCCHRKLTVVAIGCCDPPEIRSATAFCGSGSRSSQLHQRLLASRELTAQLYRRIGSHDFYYGCTCVRWSQNTLRAALKPATTTRQRASQSVSGELANQLCGTIRPQTRSGGLLHRRLMGADRELAAKLDRTERPHDVHR